MFGRVHECIKLQSTPFCLPIWITLHQVSMCVTNHFSSNLKEIFSSPMQQLFKSITIYRLNYFQCKQNNSFQPNMTFYYKKVNSTFLPQILHFMIYLMGIFKMSILGKVWRDNRYSNMSRGRERMEKTESGRVSMNRRWCLPIFTLCCDTPST
jgi:hypothetical protein